LERYAECCLLFHSRLQENHRPQVGRRGYAAGFSSKIQAAAFGGWPWLFPPGKQLIINRLNLERLLAESLKGIKFAVFIFQKVY
jgi:hypothetical protein